ncbi:hypothetical protein D7D54_01455 [Streptococcus chosunense]|uniref:Chlorohydrolase n=1 Tax=Streptococcus chosunensis TaxID=2707003 RepID=A0A3B0BM37_9STRE|nr:hypothetical protein D7D54_01455 [Streptococcus chosunense]
MITSQFQADLAFLHSQKRPTQMDRSLFSMKIKEQTRTLASGCSKHCFEVVDKTDEVSHI